jgi:hypothetical protein
MNDKILNRIYLNVPVGIKYISDWKEIINLLPKGHYILNKIVTGCGFTEYCLNNNIPTILCSPRKALLKNKHEQHLKKSKEDPKILPTYHFKNEIDKDINIDFNLTEKLSEEEKVQIKKDIKEYILGLRRSLANYISTTTTTPKILVTYDSLKHVLDTIYEMDLSLINQFQIVV